MPILAHRDLGGEGGTPLLLLHGLLGSARNWQTAGRDLALARAGMTGPGAGWHVCALDLRNHGDSFHADAMDYATLAGDVLAWMDARGLERAQLLGHSLGGKVAMRLACSRPERVGKLVVVDIAPRAYPRSHTSEFAAMQALDVATLASRQEAERQIEPFVADRAMRQFLLSNLARREEGGFRWVINLPALTAALPVLEAEFLGPEDRFGGEVLFVLGGRSRYFRDGDEARVAAHFPRARIETLAESGHNPHIEAREKFVAIVQGFLGAAGE